jgi:GDP-4-dehydro-6-deoxy-D-mannose reductase
MKTLITGINGFVGEYLKQELRNHGYDVYGMDIVASDGVFCADLLNPAAVREVICSVQPDCIFHLAGQASVKRSWDNPQLTLDVNVRGTLNLLDAVRDFDKRARLLIVGSSDEYGYVNEKDCPIHETIMPRPDNPYAISKKAQEDLALLYAKAYGMDIICTRSFNHTGPKQQKGFAIPDFASRIAEIERGLEPVLLVGNLSAKRDVSDVRDIVHAYRLLVEKGKSSGIYNVGSGNAFEVGRLLQSLIDLSVVKIEVEIDPQKFRPIDLPVVQSDISNLTNDTGFASKYTIEQTLKETLLYWREIQGA